MKTAINKLGYDRYVVTLRDGIFLNAGTGETAKSAYRKAWSTYRHVHRNNADTTQQHGPALPDCLRCSDTGSIARNGQHLRAVICDCDAGMQLIDDLYHADCEYATERAFLTTVGIPF